MQLQDNFNRGGDVLSLSDALPDLQKSLREKDSQGAKANLAKVFPGVPEKQYIRKMVDLAASARNKAQLDKAVELYRTAIKVQELCFQSDQMEARQAMHCLIIILKEQNKASEAEPYLAKLRL
jgi:hypothetical protein